MNDDLFTHLDRIKDNLKGYPDIPDWNEILLIEDTNILHGDVMQLPEWALTTPEDYKQRFQELINQGYGWINLVTNGILNKTIILSVEIPLSSSGLPSEKVSVNLSGPYLENDGAPRWDINKTVVIV